MMEGEAAEAAAAAAETILAPEEDAPEAEVVAKPTKKDAKAAAKAAKAAAKAAKDAKKEKKARKPSGPWRQRITLSGMLLWTVVGTILVVSGFIGYYAISVIMESKQRDTWAILFLELEQQGAWITKRIEKFSTQHGDPSQTTPGHMTVDGIITLPQAGPGAAHEKLKVVRGPFQGGVSLSDFHLKTPELPARWTVLQLAGHDYLAVTAPDSWINTHAGDRVAPGNYLVLWRIDINSWLNARADEAKNSIYLITKEGRVLYTNRPEINETNFVKRPLVQKFIANPLRHGQLEFDGEEGASYGFFHEVPDTNLMLFVETSKKVALEEVNQIAIRYTIFLLAILAVVGLLLQFPLSTLVAAPMRELVRVADEVGDGNFDVYPRRQGLGELAVLTSSFTEMAKNLVVRDKKIQSLLVEQEEKFRLADELAIAHSIQNNFLIHTPLPKDSGVEVAAQYTPATEVAGDWYGYYYEPQSGQSVFAVADVSGHGAGSAMFTAIIAATFEELRTVCTEAGALFPMEEFAMRLNRLIKKLGHGEMHATLLLAAYQKGSHEIQVLNAGHPFPMLLQSKENGGENEPLMLRSDPLGLDDGFHPAMAQVAFPRGTALFMFTDGLTEGHPAHKLYSERRLAKAATISASTNINQMVIRVYEDWKKHLQGQPPVDDVCLMALRAVA